MNKRKRKKLAKKKAAREYWRKRFEETWLEDYEKIKELGDIYREFQTKSKT